jgi:hypothetical protein
MPCGFGQTLDLCRKALFLWAWHSLFATEQFYTKLLFYNTVVLG